MKKKALPKTKRTRQRYVWDVVPDRVMMHLDLVVDGGDVRDEKFAHLRALVIGAFEAAAKEAGWGSRWQMALRTVRPDLFDRMLTKREMTLARKAKS